MEFRDRQHAGQVLAEALSGRRAERPVVVALPRGGVPVAVEVARSLDAPLEILAVRKLGAPGHPEYGVGAVAEDGTAVLDGQAAAMAGMTQEILEQTLDSELAELVRRVETYRAGRAPLALEGRTVIVVDDGIATGLTDLAAVRAVRSRGAAKIVVAAPVAAPESVSMLSEEADEVVCVSTPRVFGGVGRWYRDFSPVSDDEVLSLLAEAGAGPVEVAQTSRELVLEFDGVQLNGDLTVPEGAQGLVLFAHGSGSSRLSVRNRAVARYLNESGMGTLLFDLLSEREAGLRELVFDIPLLTARLEGVTRWALRYPATAHLPIGYFGASTGAAAALRAAAEVGGAVRAVVSRGGRPDLAADRLGNVLSPTLLIVGAEDHEVLALNRQAATALRCTHELAIVERAGHLFEEPGTLEQVAQLAATWFQQHLPVPAEPPQAVGAG